MPGCVGLKDFVPSMEFKSVGQCDILADVFSLLNFLAFSIYRQEEQCKKKKFK